MEIVFVTHNKHKLEEAAKILPNTYHLLDLDEIGCREDIPETAETLEGNALIKARYVYNRYKMNCFADDTGLEIDALGGKPGVYSARWAGENCSYADNVDKVLSELKGVKNRKARFRTVIALILDGKEHLFEGMVAGKITEKPEGNAGFGYDPVFRPQGYRETFAQMAPGLKNAISHRGLAMKKLIRFLNRRV